MGEVWVPQGSFASGELAPSVHGLVTSEQFRTGCHTLTNALLTPTGSARKRFGTQDIGSTTSGFPAALFAYAHGGRRFVIQFVSQDDDAGDLNTANRQVRVLDAETRAFVNFGDNLAHGPFTSFGSAAAYHHHFTATQLRSVYAFQDGTRIVFCHKDRPPLFMERVVVESAESWKYGVVASGREPVVVDYRIPVSINWDGTKFTSSIPFFTPADEHGSYWRVMGPAADVLTQPCGVWVQAGGYISSTQMKGTIQSGALNSAADESDWCGPFVNTGSDLAATINSASSSEQDVKTITFGSSFLKQNVVGTLLRLNGNTLWIVETVLSGTVATIRRLSAPGGVVPGTPTNVPTQICNFAPDSANNPGRGRTWVKEFPIIPNGTSGTVTLTSIKPIVVGPADATDFNWLPAGHETTFDTIGNGGTAVGGAVILGGERVALTGTTSPDSGGLTYQGRVIAKLPHRGPFIQTALGWSHGVGFPRCGVGHQARHYFGGFEMAPAAIVASEPGNPDNLATAENDDSPFTVKIVDPLGGTPVWMESGDDLLIGTTMGEGAIAGAPITPSNLAWARQTAYGGNNVRPLLIGPGALFASGYGLREMAFRYENESYEAPDLTDIAKHLFKDVQVTQLEYLSHPLQTVYIRNANDKLFAMSYYRSSGVIGFSPFTQPAYPKATGTQSEDSTIESMAAVRFGSSIVEDELWVVRRFTSGGHGGAGSTVRRIERMTPAFGMDQVVIDLSPTTTTISSGSLFVELLGDFRPRVTLDGVDIGVWPTSVGGVATYATQPSTPDEGQIGRSIPWELIPLIQDPGGDRSTAGATVGRVNAINALVILLNESRGGRVRGKPLDPTLVEFTGWKFMPGIGVAGSPPLVSITHDLAYAFEVAGLNLKASYG